MMLITHEWVSSIGGSENVFRELLATFPEADAGCLWNDMPDTFDRPVLESHLARSRLRNYKAAALFAMPKAWRQFPLGDHETVLASSHAFGHHLAARAAREGRRAFAYVHTPARYIWAPEVEDRGQGPAARAGSIPLRRIDRKNVDDRVRYVANSQYIRNRIQRCWGVDAEVIYPPVNVERIQSVRRWRDILPPEEEKLFTNLPPDGFLLGASRLVSYKRLDLVIELGEAMGMPVVIAGDGPERSRLEAMAASARIPVHIVGRVTDEQLYSLYQEASLFVFPAIEDFGIMPIECMAAGTPVLVNAVGGAKESVVALRTGESAPMSGAALAAVPHAEAAMQNDMQVAVADVGSFSVDSFRQQVSKWAGSA
jgi:glycosyltransferase involved in cell wall biosynthesis